MDDDLDAWLFGDPTALLPTNNPYAEILSQFPENTNLDDYVVTENGLIKNAAGDTGTFKDGKWVPYTGGDVKTFLTGSSASRFINFAKQAKDALSSPQGIAGLVGAALGYFDRPKPTGGGTTMAYPGAAKLERRMVQGPYGPLAEYTGVGGGAPDYTPFKAPTFAPPPPAAAPAPAPGAGMSVQSKIDLYKQLAGYGLGADRIRRIAETMYGAIPDSDWNELTRLAGTGAGIAAPKPGGITTPAATKPPAAPAPAPAAPAVQQQAAPDSTPAPGAASSATSFPEKRIWSQEVLEHAREQNPRAYAQMYASMTPEMQAAEDADEAGRRAVQEGIDRATALRNDPAEQMRQYGYVVWPKPSGLAKGGEARAYAGGKPLTMEDGGFVFTKRATDKLGPRGIAALGGKKIVAPGNGTDDKGITGIIGKHGVTPARVSNGESYFPPGHDTKKLYALMHSLERKA